MPRWRLAGLELEAVASVDLRQQPQLNRLGRLGRSAGDDLAPMFGVGSEHAVVAQHVKARRGDQGHQPRDEVEGIEDHGVGAVPPRSLESNDQAATIGRDLEAFLRERWPRNVSAQSLEPPPITTVNRTRVHIDPAHVGERLVGRRELADRMHELARPLAGLGAQQLAVASRRAVAGGERGLVLAELVGRIVELAQVTTVARAYADESRVGRACDGGDILGGRAPERAKAQLAIGLGGT